MVQGHGNQLVKVRASGLVYFMTLKERLLGI